ncbi:MAG: hypothetical protein IKR49_03310 [Clostridia bacterium]|nr:hypothetical protein [Clostridia bacterium]
MIFHLTDAGRALLEGSMVDGPNTYGVRFTRVELGNGPAQDAAEATALNNPILTGLFATAPEIDTENNCIKMTTTVSNESLNVGFNVTEAGYYAGKLVNGSSTVTDVVLFAIGNEPAGEAFRIPSKAESVTSFDFEFDLYVSDVDNINAILSENASYASVEDFNRHITDFGNPHNVNKAQIGLSEVPNVSTNDQTPTFTEANILALLNGSEDGGDTLAELLSKLAKGQHEFIDHKADTNNPHKITAKGIGASEAGHTHDTKDIASGVLTVEHGGTGLSFGAKETATGYSCRLVYEAPGGLLIQGGRMKKEKGVYNVDINFNRPYKDTNYVFLFGTYYGDIPNSALYTRGVDPAWFMPNRYVDHVTMRSDAFANTEYTDWLAVGIAAK